MNDVVKNNGLGFEEVSYAMVVFSAFILRECAKI